MLVLTRKAGEAIHIGGGVVIKVLDIRPSRIRLGISAPPTVRVRREEKQYGSEDQAVAEMLPFSVPAGIC